MKDAFSAPDWQQNEVFGVPDKFVGKTITKQHLYSGRLLGPSPGFDKQILVAPTPGHAFWQAEITTVHPGVDINYDGVEFIDTPTSFPPNNEAMNFTSARVVSLAVEIVPTGNALVIDGVMAVAKVPLRMTPGPVTTSGDLQYFITGAEGLGTPLARAPWTKPMAEGVFSVSSHTQPDWDFRPIVANVGDVRFSGTTLGKLDVVAGATGVTCLDDMDTIVIRLAPGSYDGEYHIMVWMTVEYQVQPNSILADMAHASPGMDELAMYNYREMASKMPIAVVQRRNAGFWDTMLSVARSVASGLSFIPGPVGMIASGVRGLMG